jgi:hypothetical protein
MSLSTKEREKHVLECLGQNKSYREIQALFHISPREISSIVQKAKEKNDIEEEKKLQRTITSKAYKLFAKGKDLLHVATTLGIGAPEAKKIYTDYLDLKGSHHITEVLQQFDRQTIRNFSSFYTTNDNRIDEKKLIEAIKISTGLPKIKEEYNNNLYKLSFLRKQVSLLQGQIDYFSSRNKFLIDKNLELQDGLNLNLIRNKIKEYSIEMLKRKDPRIRSSIMTILKIIKDDPEKEILINNNNNNNNNNLHFSDQKISKIVAKFNDAISETIVNSIINSNNNNNYNYNYETYNSQEKV